MQRPQVPGGFYDAQKGTKTNIMCSACNLFCHPEKKVRAKRLEMWTQGGVSIEHDDGTIETMPLDEARAYLDALPMEKRALFEDVALVTHQLDAANSFGVRRRCGILARAAAGWRSERLREGVIGSPPACVFGRSATA